MRSPTLVIAAAIAAALWVSDPPGGVSPGVPETRIERASHLLFDATASEASATQGLVALLDAVGEAAPGSGLDGRWPEKVARARDLLTTRSPGDAEVRDLLLESYREATGTAYAFPASVVRFSDAVALGRKQLEEARRALADGRNADGVRLLLSTGLLVVTPMPAPAARP